MLAEAKKVSVAILLTAVLLGPTLLPLSPISAQQRGYSLFGPRMDEWEVKFIPDYSVRLLAFEAGEIDWFSPLPRDLERVKASKPIAELGGEIIRTQGYSIWPMVWFNNRDRIGRVGSPDDPDITLPYNVVSNVALRKAIAHIVNRDEIIFGPILQGHAVRHNTFLPPIYGDWVNPDADFDVLYGFSIEAANRILDEAGFTRGPDGFRTYRVPEKDPFGFPYKDAGMVKPLEIEILTYPEALVPFEWQTAKMLEANLLKLGIRSKLVPADPLTKAAKVVGAREFQVAVWGWGLGIYPTILRLFHSSWDIWSKDRRPLNPFGFYGINKHIPQSAELDKVIEAFETAPDIEEAKVHARKAQAILMEIVPWVPIVQGVSYTAVAGNWKGVVKMWAPPGKEPVGIDTDLSLFNLHMVDPVTKAPTQVYGTKFRDAMGLIPGTLNRMTYLFVGESYVLHRVYEGSQNQDPENIYGPPIPNLITGISKEFMEVAGKPGVKYTVSIKPGIRWHDGVPLTAYDWEFAILKAGREWGTLRYGPLVFIRNLDRVEVVDPLTINIYVKTKGWLVDVEVNFFIPLPRHIFGRLPDPFADVSRLPHPERPDLTAMIGTGPFMTLEHQTGRSVRLVWNPDYHRADPGKTLKLEVSLARSVEEGKPFTLSVLVKDYLGNPATNAVVTATLKGPVTSTHSLGHVGEGRFSTTLTATGIGDYTVEVSAKQPIKVGGKIDSFLRASTTVPLNIRAPGLPPPPTVEKPEEVAPTPIALPKPPEVGAAETLPPTPAVPASTPLTLQVLAAVIILALGVFVARRRGP
jgi:ABC-type transport system substrate-binding protein